MLNEGIKDNARSSRSPKIYKGKFIGMYREDLYTIATICGCRSRRYSTSFLCMDFNGMNWRALYKIRANFSPYNLWNDISAVNISGEIGAFKNEVENFVPVAWCRLVQSDDSYLDVWTSSSKLPPLADPPNWKHRFFIFKPMRMYRSLVGPSASTGIDIWRSFKWRKVIVAKLLDPPLVFTLAL